MKRQYFEFRPPFQFSNVLHFGLFGYTLFGHHHLDYLPTSSVIHLWFFSFCIYFRITLFHHLTFSLTLCTVKFNFSFVNWLEVIFTLLRLLDFHFSPDRLGSDSCKFNMCLYIDLCYFVYVYLLKCKALEYRKIEFNQNCLT